MQRIIGLDLIRDIRAWKIFRRSRFAAIVAFRKLNIFSRLVTGCDRYYAVINCYGFMFTHFI